MKCPYCNEEMVKGYIYGDRWMLKWLPEEKDLLFGIWAKGGIKLGEETGIRPSVETYMCRACNKFIIDLNKDKNS